MKFISALFYVGVCFSAPSSAHSEEWSPDQVRNAKVAYFDADTAMGLGNRDEALRLIVESIPVNAPVSGEVPVVTAQLMDLLERVYLGEWVVLSERYEFDWAWLSPNGTRLLSQLQIGNGTNELVLWNVETGQRIETFQGVYKVAPGSNPGFSADDGLLVWMADEETLEVVNAETGAVLHNLAVFKKQPNVNFWYGTIDVSPSAKLAIVPGDYEGWFTIVNIRTGEIQFSLTRSGRQPSVRFASNVPAFKPAKLSHNHPIEARFRNDEVVCLHTIASTSGKKSFSTYSGEMDINGQEIVFDTIIEDRRPADGVFKCTQHGARALKTYIDPELRKENDFEERHHVLVDGKNIEGTVKHGRRLGGVSFSKDETKAIFHSQNPVLVDLERGTVLFDFLDHKTPSAGGLRVVDEQGVKVGDGWRLSVPEILFEAPFSKEKLLSAAQTELSK